MNQQTQTTEIAVINIEKLEHEKDLNAFIVYSNGLHIEQAKGLAKEAKQIIIIDSETYALANNSLKTIKKSIKAMDDYRKATTKPVKDKILLFEAKFKPIKEILDQAKRDTEYDMKAYDRKVIAEEAEIAVEAKKKLDEENTEKQAEIDALQDAGEFEQAELVEATKEDSVAIPINQHHSSAKGLSRTPIFVTMIANNDLAIKDIISKPELHHLLDINLSRTKALVKQTEGKIKIDGVIIESDVSLTSR